MATIDYKQLATPEANLIELLAAQNQDGTYTAKLMGSEPFAVLAAKTIYNAYNDIEDNMAADVEGPASSTDNALARFDGTTGKLLQNSNAILTDAGALSLASNLTVSGATTVKGQISSVTNSTIIVDYVTGGDYGRLLSPNSAGNYTTPIQIVNGLTVGGNLTVSGTTGVTATDFTLGSSGPSVKSSLSARAPRQGLVFDGTAGATATISALGTAPFTVSAVFSAKSLAANNAIIDFNTGVGSSILIYVTTTGRIVIYDRVANATLYQSNTGVIEVNKIYHIAYARGVGVFVNGVNISGSFADGSNYTDTVYRIGWAASNDSFCTGFLSVLIYNRALSASEVVSLYEAGAPAGADYGLIGQPASNTSIITGDSSTFTGGVGNWTGFNGGSISAVGGKGVIAMASYHQGAANNTNQMVAGRRYRLTVTVSALAGGSYVLLTDYNSVEYASLTAGVNVVEFISRSNTGIAFKQGNSGTTSASVDDISLLPIGLLLAPDAAQAGGGLVWYDTSGNAANITLPASGVSWNVPFAGYVTAPTTTNLTLAGGSSGASLALGQGTTGTFTFTLPSISAGSTTWVSAGAVGIGIDFKRATATSTIGGVLASLNGYNGATRAAIFEFIGDGATDSGRFDWWVKPTAGSLTQAMVLKSNGNLLIGTTTDGGQKLQVSGAIAATTGAANNALVARYNSSNSLFGVTVNSAGQGVVSENTDASTGSDKYSKTGLPAFRLGNTGGSGTVPFWIDVAASGTAGNAITWTNAFQIDSSQNATFAGNALVKSFVTLAGPTSGTSFLHWKETSVADRGVLGFEAGSSTLKYRAGGYSMATGTEVFSISSTGAIAIGNTVQTAVGVASTHKVTISIGGSTYYLLATNV